MISSARASCSAAASRPSDDDDAVRSPTPSITTAVPSYRAANDSSTLVVSVRTRPVEASTNPTDRAIASIVAA